MQAVCLPSERRKGGARFRRPSGCEAFAWLRTPRALGSHSPRTSLPHPLWPRLLRFLDPALSALELSFSTHLGRGGEARKSKLCLGRCPWRRRFRGSGARDGLTEVGRDPDRGGPWRAKTSASSGGKAEDRDSSPPSRPLKLETTESRSRETGYRRASSLGC